MVVRLPGFAPKHDEGFAKSCPKDCPFRCNTSGLIMCQFALYADKLEPGRLTRLEVEMDDNYRVTKEIWHIPPECDVYEKYKGKDVGRLDRTTFSLFLRDKSDDIY